MITANTDIARILPSFLYKILAQNWIDHRFPRHLFIETTANCNLTCEYCPREKKNDCMAWDLFKSIVDEANQYGPRSFSLHLFGEPLLYPRILDAIAYIKSLNKRHTVLLTTNGTVLNKFAQELEKVGVDRVIWSYRKNNFNSDSIKLLRKRGLVRLLIEETPKEEFEKWSKFPRVEVKHLHNYGGQIDTTKWNIPKPDPNVQRYPCYHLWLAPAVRWNGDITICCNDPHGAAAIANYKDVTITEVWGSTSMFQLREGHKEGKFLGICKGCDVWKTYPDLWFKNQKSVSASVS